ncbi:MAG TPA: serine hydrolase [Rhodothermales bacterium]|nr:serine hydrolase [Rhodothermales bacterium]
MERSLHEILADYPEATVGIAVRDLEAGTSFEYNADRVFHAASTMKVPVMIEVFRQAEAGRFGLDDSVTVTNQFRSIVDGSQYILQAEDDTDDDVYEKIGSEVPIRRLVDRMIAVSSNLAANILIDLVGADSVQSTIERLGTSTMRVYRGVEDLKAFERGMNNTATAGDLAVLLHAMAEGRAVSKAADEEMIGVLLRQEFTDMIPAGLPDGARAAHKTGSITRIHHDAAIVYPPGRSPYVLVIMTEGIDETTRSAKLGAEISSTVYSMLTAG